jgi:hypothetical protein
MNRSRSSFGLGSSRMAALCAVFFFAALVAIAHRPAVASRKPDASIATRSRAMNNFAQLPLGFEPNQGQLESGINFAARGGGFEAFLDPAGATLIVGAPALKTAIPGKHQSAGQPARLQLAQIRMSLLGASDESRPQPEERLPGVVNYYRGRDRTKWHRDVPTYQRVKYADVYRGIDLAYYGNHGSFEFDFDLKPGADANQIALAVSGLERAELTSDGAALLKTAKGDLMLKRPVAYQQIDGERRSVQAGYRIVAASNRSHATRIAIALGEYDHSRALTIDPVLLFSTFFGGTTTEITAAALDSSGDVYVTGFAFDCSTCTNFPTTTGPIFAGDVDAFISEISDAGSLVYSTLIGGNNFDEGKALAVDGGGNAYLTGVTFSTDFPETIGPSTAPGNGDAFVAKFGTSGAVTWATYLGGSEFDEPFSLAIPQGCPSNCNAYIAGHTGSSNFPGASGFTGEDDGFVTEMNANGSSPPVYTTLLAGNIGPTGANSGLTFATGIAVDSNGIAFVAGGTDATDFPKTVGPALTGATDAFAAKLNAGGSVSFARLLGGSDFDEAEGIAIQPNCTEPCSAYVDGVTFSSNFPTTGGALQTALTGPAAEFITELSGDGSTTTYSTLLGPSDAPLFAEIGGIAVDTAGQAFVIGATASSSFGLDNQVGAFPGPNGALYEFEEGPPGPSPTAAPTKIAWPKSNGSPLTIQQSNSGSATVVGSTTGILITTDGVDFSQATATGLPSGPVTAVDYETSLTPNVIFASAGGGVYVSTNLGATFSLTGLSKASEFIVDLAGNSLSDTDVLVGTVGAGLWSSTNGGTSFIQVSSIPATATVFALTSNGKNPPFQVFAGTSRGVFTAPNFSASNFPGTWTATNLSMSAVASMTSDRNSTPIVDYAGTYFQGLYESTDNFNSYVLADVPQFSYTAIELDRDNGTTPATVFAGVNAIDQGFVYQNPSGYEGAFVDTNFENLPGNVKGLKNPYVGEVLQYHPVIAELNPGGTQLLFSSYLGGSSFDTAGGIAVDAAGANIYVAGTTFSSDFPTQGTALSTYHGFSSGFITKIGPAASSTATPSPSPTGSPTPTPAPTPTPSITPTATPTQTPIPTQTPTATATPTPTPAPNGSKLKVAASLTFRPVGIGIGASSTAKLVIANTGKVGNLIGMISNPTDPEFTFSAGNAFSIAPRKSLTIPIAMMPTGTAPMGTVSITSNGGNATVTLKGTGLTGKLSVRKSLTIVATATGGAGSMTFTPGTANLVLKNVGKGLLMGSSMLAMPNPPFSGGGGSGGGGILPGKTSTVQITFSPSTTSPATGSIQLVATPPNTGSATVKLKGIVKVKK